MAITANWYNRAVERQASGASPANWTSDTIRAALLVAGHTPNLDTHEFWADVSADETAGDGYTPGGAVLASKSVVRITAKTTLRAAQSQWTPGEGESLSAGYVVVYKDTGDDATSPLLGLADLDGEMTATGGPFTVAWHETDGVLYIEAV